jgi:hypothetical protein
VNATYHLLQTPQLGGSWTTNFGAAFVTNVPNQSYQFITPNTAAAQYYRVATP